MIIKGELSPNMKTFLSEKGIAESQILNGMLEHTEANWNFIQDELADKLIPVSEQLVILLSEVRALAKGLKIQYGVDQSPLALGISEQKVTKMVEIACFYNY